MSATIALFDIDGTLVTCGGAGRRAMDLAFTEAGATTDALAFDFGGMTDRAIARQGLRAAGLPDDDAALEALLARYLQHLHDEVPRSAAYQVLPGVHELVSRLLEVEGFAVGLGTGNLAQGARVKLERGGLHERFAFGGFGSDHEDRAKLLAIGAERGAAQLGRPLHECRIIVIGDTPRDVAAARAIGAECLGVGTGRHDAASLLASGAHEALDDLAHPRAWSIVRGA